MAESVVPLKDLPFVGDLYFFHILKEEFQRFDAEPGQRLDLGLTEDEDDGGYSD